jgi:ubiquitin carboxyl-terminal hydrolase L5
LLTSFLGASGSADWTEVARPHIEARILQYEQDQLSFNLLGVCKCPLVQLSQDLARSIHKLERLTAHMKTSDSLRDIIMDDPTAIKSAQDPRVATYNIASSPTTGVSDEQLDRKLANPSFGAIQALDLQQMLLSEQERLIHEYESELASNAEDEQRVKGRRKDHTPAIHAWVKKLAEHGVLEDLMNEK